MSPVPSSPTTTPLASIFHSWSRTAARVSRGRPPLRVGGRGTTLAAKPARDRRHRRHDGENTMNPVNASIALEAGTQGSRPFPSALARALRRCRSTYRGVMLALAVAAAARFFSDHYGAPAMLFALLFGIAFNFLSTDDRCAPGIEFASKTLLRAGVALLGFRLSLSEIASLGASSLFAVAGLLVLTIAFGILVAPLLGRHWRFGLLTGGAVAICGAAAALPTTALLPPRGGLAKEPLFSARAVTTLFTAPVVTYPILTKLLRLGDAAAR